MISSLFNNIINLIGVAFMGRVGETELAASGIGALLFITLTMIPYGLSVGIQIIIARRAGEKDERSIGAVFNNNFLFMFLVGSLMFATLKWAVPAFLQPIFSSQAVYEAAMVYLSYRVWELFLAAFAFLFIAFYTSIGKNQIITWSALSMLVVNVFFNYCLVFGEMGFPAMGIAGAGLASLISSCVAMCINFVYLIASPLRKKFELFRLKRFDWSVVNSGLKLSGPVVLQHVLSTGTWVLFFLLIERMGSGALAASNVAKEVYMVLGVTTWGFANATNSLVSNILGQNRHAELFDLLKKVLVISFSFSMFFCLLIVVKPEVFISIFTNDLQIVELAKNPVRICGSCLVMMSVASVLFRAVTGTGATKYSLLLELITLLVYVAYVVVLVPVLHVNLTVAWTSELVYWFIMGSLCWYYLKRGNWKSIRL